jgi:uncharacterized protein YecT (DUF1311 family)
VLAAVTVLLLAAPHVAAAQAHGGGKAPAPRKAPISAYERCMNGPIGRTQIGMQQCAAEETARHDARLNRNYKAILDQLDSADDKDAVRNAQRAWIAFRDADCGSYVSMTWGSMSRLEGAQCMTERTEERADQLQSFLESHVMKVPR